MSLHIKKVVLWRSRHHAIVLDGRSGPLTFFLFVVMIWFRLRPIIVLCYSIFFLLFRLFSHMHCCDGFVTSHCSILTD